MKNPPRSRTARVGGGTAWLLLVFLGGCALRRGAETGPTSPAAASDAPAFARAAHTLQGVFPPDYRATHRAIITARHRQFVCDGLLRVSPADGWHLALVSPLGLITNLRGKPDGGIDVLKVTPLLREEWSRDYVAREVRWLFGAPPPLTPVGRLDDGRLLLETATDADGLRARYVCRADGSRWEEFELRAGRRRLCRAEIRNYRAFPGCPQEVPTDIAVEAGTHTLHIRVVAVSVAPRPTEEAP